jgi:hypothetical protein
MIITITMERINNPEALVGKKCKGFKFKDDKLMFTGEMESYVGREGVIRRYSPDDNVYRIDFPGDFWYYPANEQVFDNLID